MAVVYELSLETCLKGDRSDGVFDIAVSWVCEATNGKLEDKDDSCLSNLRLTKF